MDKLGGRKLIGAVLVITVGLIVTMLKGDIPAHLGELLEVVFGAFVLGNAAEHGATLFKTKSGAVLEAPPPQNTANIESGIVLIQQLLQLIIKKTGIDKMEDKK